MAESQRHQELYVFRGCTIIAMVCYHALLVRQFVDSGTFTGSWIAYPIALTFMFLSGISISLVDAQVQEKRGKTYSRVIFRLSLSALLVTLITYVALPEYRISFGILHLILVSYVVFYIRDVSGSRYVLPMVVVSIVALLDYLRVTYIMSSRSLDYTPIYMFFIVVVFGYILGRHFYGRGQQYPFVGSRAVAFLGRYSLFIYLVHIPVLYVLLGGTML